MDVEINYSDHDEEYMEKMKKHIPEAIESFQPDFVLYNAGTDCLINDPLGSIVLK